jgi:hypothetical protein
LAPGVQRYARGPGASDRLARRASVPEEGPEELQMEGISLLCRGGRPRRPRSRLSPPRPPEGGEGEDVLGRPQRIERLGLEHPLLVALGTGEVVGGLAGRRRPASQGIAERWDRARPARKSPSANWRRLCAVIAIVAAQLWVARSSTLARGPEEALHVVGVDPGGAQPCGDLIRSEVAGEHLAKRGHVGMQAGVVGRGCLRAM